MRVAFFMVASFLLLTAQTATAAGKWQPVLEIEGRTNADRSILSPKLLLPLSQTADSMLFTDIRLRMDDNGSKEYNLGLGFRQMQGDWILGGYGFIDYLGSANGFKYWQATGGVEALSDTWQARMNAYLPEATQYGAIGAGTLVVDGGGNFGISGLSRERALPGADAEVGYRLPINSTDLTLFGGAYYFNASGFDKVAGPKARAELTFDSRTLPSMLEGTELTFGVQYQNDGPREGVTTALAKLRIPFGGGPRAPAKRTLEKHMTTFIARDIDIIAAAGGHGGYVPATATINGQTYSKIGATIDANTVGVNASLTAAGAGALVVFDGTAGAIAPGANITALNGQALLGGGSSITVNADGNSATGVLAGTRPTVQNMIFASNVSNVAVKGIDVNTATGGGVFVGGGGTSNFLIEDVNAVTSANGDFGVRVFLASDVVINNVTANAPTLASIGISGTGVTLTDVTTLGNTGVYVQAATNVSGTVDATASAVPCDNQGGNTNVTINFVGGGTCP